MGLGYYFRSYVLVLGHRNLDLRILGNRRRRNGMLCYAWCIIEGRLEGADTIILFLPFTKLHDRMWDMAGRNAEGC